MLTAPAGVALASPTLSADELELFYVRFDTATESHFRRSTRGSRDEMFGAGTAVGELDSVCALTDLRSIDLSPDGLRAYVVCYPTPDQITEGALRIAQRIDADSPFVFDGDSYGTVGSSAAIDSGELVVYSSAQMNAPASPPLMYERSALDAPFGMAEPVPGLGDGAFSTPDPTPDGLGLYGAAEGEIVVASRVRRSDEFASPMTVLPGEPSQTTVVLGAPEISRNCNSLYFVRADVGDSGATYSIRAVTTQR